MAQTSQQKSPAMKMPKGPMRGRGMPVPKGAIKKGTLSRLLKLVFKYYKPHRKLFKLCAVYLFTFWYIYGII